MHILFFPDFIFITHVRYALLKFMAKNITEFKYFNKSQQ